MKERLNYLFTSTKGLILVAIAMVTIVTAIWGMLSGPMAEIGMRDIVVRLLHMDLKQAEREGRIIILYHSIAMAVIAIEPYMITGLLKMKPFFKTAINATIMVGFYNGTKYRDYQTIDSPSPYGLYDMAGNVWQWMGDVYEGMHYRFLRGGSKDVYDMDLRIWVRNNATPTYYSPGVGFRCAR